MFKSPLRLLTRSEVARGSNRPVRSWRGPRRASARERDDLKSPTPVAPLLSPTASPESVLDDVPDRGLWPGIAYRLGLKRTTHVWGCEFTLRDPGIAPQAAWLLRNGRWERPEILLSLRHMDPSLPLVEIGGGLGTTCCVLNRRLKDPAQHVVLEMDPLACRIIAGNRDRNGAAFDLRPVAIGYGAGQQRMTRKGKTFDWGNRLDKDAQGDVAGKTSLRQVLADRKWSKVNLLMDIEGAEEAVLANEGDVLTKHVRTLVLEVHPWVMAGTGVAQVLERIHDLGFRLVDLEGMAYAFVNGRMKR